MPASHAIPFEGVLNCWNDEHDLPDLLLAVSRSGKTGRLQFSNAEADKTLYVKEGRFVFAESSSDDDALGQYLLRIGKLSFEDYVRVGKLVEPGKRLGALLVAEKVIEPKDLVPAVVGQVRAIILSLFRRTETWYGFKQEELKRKESITLDMPVAQLILDGVLYVDSWRRVSKGVGDLDSVYRLSRIAEAESSQLTLESAVAELITTLKEPISVSHLCTQARIPDFDACRYLWAFRALDWIEPAEIAAEDALDAPLDVEAAMRADVEMQVITLPPLPRPPPPAQPVEPVPVTQPIQPVQSAQPVAPDLTKTVIDVAPVRPPIPQRLIETRISTAPDKPAAAPPPKREDLDQTRHAIDPPPALAAAASAAPKPAPAGAPSPKPIPNELVHTRFYVGAPAAEPEAITPSTGEMMEAILSDAGSVPAPAAPAPRPTPDASTRLFPGPSVLDGFDSIDYDVPPAIAPSTLPHVTPMPSFQDLSLSGSVPIVEADIVPADSTPEGPASGLEIFASDAPFGPGETSAPPPKTPPAPALTPKGPRTEELDLEMDGFGHLLGD
jgi:hypothetical protein